MKTVITGANSFIGLHLAEKLSAEGWESILVTRPGHGIELPRNAQLLQLPMEQYSELGKLTGGCDCFIHLAWKGTRGPLRLDRDVQSKNVFYSMQGIESMLRAGCGKVVLAGSQAEYGLQSSLTSETAVCKPYTEYGKAKLILSQRVAESCISKNVDYKLLRIFSIYGPGDHFDTMIMSVLNDMLQNRPCKLTHCTQLWDYLYISDAVEAITMLCSKACANGIYNIASGDVRPLRSFVEEMRIATHTDSQIIYGALPSPETGKIEMQPDVVKLHQELNFVARTDFKMGINQTIDFLRK